MLTLWAGIQTPAWVHSTVMATFACLRVHSLLVFLKVRPPWLSLCTFSSHWPTPGASWLHSGYMRDANLHSLTEDGNRPQWERGGHGRTSSITESNERRGTRIGSICVGESGNFHRIWHASSVRRRSDRWISTRISSCLRNQVKNCHGPSHSSETLIAASGGGLRIISAR